MNYKTPKITTADRLGRLLLKNGVGFCQCAVCHRVFTGDSPFSRHRIGPYNGIRRCLTAGEMAEIGMYLNDDGRWEYGTSINQINADTGKKYTVQEYLSHVANGTIRPNYHVPGSSVPDNKFDGYGAVAADSE